MATHDLQGLLDGTKRIDGALAERLSVVLGGSPKFWLTRDEKYQEAQVRRRDYEQSWAESFPLRDMTRFGWVAADSTSVGRILSFFGSESVTQWTERYGRIEQDTAFRASATYESDPRAVAAWLRQGEILASEVETEAWDRVKFRESLSAIRSISRIRQPERFLPKLTRACADAGVAFVLVRGPKGCTASGAARFVNGKPVIQLSFRHLSDDHFWFSFFHEAGHLVLHSNTEVFLDGIADLSNTVETEANEFAAQQLIPFPIRDRLRVIPRNSMSVIRLASELGISPGIVVGQMQHEGLLRRNQLNGLKRRYGWNDD